MQVTKHHIYRVDESRLTCLYSFVYTKGCYLKIPLQHPLLIHAQDRSPVEVLVAPLGQTVGWVSHTDNATTDAIHSFTATEAHIAGNSNCTDSQQAPTH
jgi:hypothetical protein